MDHNLDDSLNLESPMGVDFEQPEDIVVSEAGMSLEPAPHEESMPMEFEHTEEQPILMDTANEEIIVSEFMGDQFTLQEYSVQSDQTTGLTTTVESNQHNVLTSHPDTMIDMQFQPQIMATGKTEILPPKLIAVKNLPAPRPSAKKPDTAIASVPRQVAIAPKPPKLVTMKPYTQPKQLAIAPKPLNMPANRGQSLVKKVSIANVVPGTTKANPVLAHLGKQLIMMPSGSQKIKLVSSTGTLPNIQYIRADPDQAQLIAAKNVSSTQTKPLLTKLFAVQGKPNADVTNQPAVITKILPAGSGNSDGQPRLVTLPQKAMPITFGNKVIMATPAKQGLVKLTKKQEIITIKSPTAKLLPAPALVPVSGGGPVKNKVLLTNTTKNVVIKPNTPSKTEVSNDGTIVIEKQKSQLHQIRVPGKGVQYVRLYTNPTPAAPKPATKTVTLNSKTFVLTDSKGNIIQMTAEKMSAGQPPSLVIPSNANTSTYSAPKAQHKLVRITPVVTTTTQAATLPGRPSQSLLAPLSPVPITTSETILPEIKTLLEEEPEPSEEVEEAEEEVDSKSALRQLIEHAVSEDLGMNEVEIEYKQQQSPAQDNSMDNVEQQESSGQSEEQQHLVMLPAKYEPHQPEDPLEEQSSLDDSEQTDNMINMDSEAMNNTFQLTKTISETELVSTDLGLRPRKACNCTKSQCLKLYCDCFANGEFCNNCNCVNCHNNLENEELRQMAIRGCLDRNPNAFRPKIGKSKTAGGPEIIRRHNKGCNCKRSGCLKNYCECYEAKIACTPICKCVGCRNVEETLERRHRNRLPRMMPASPPVAPLSPKQPCSFMTTEVIEAVCQCLLAAAVESKEPEPRESDPVRDVIEEFARCLQDIISAAHQSAPAGLVGEEPA